MKTAREPIKDVSDFNDECDYIFECFLESMQDDSRFLRKADREDDPEEADYMYTDRGNTLANRMLDRLHKIGAKYFDPLDIEISSRLYQEY